MKALLFINGNPPEHLPALEGYDIIAGTDGAFSYLKQLGFPFDKLDFISGDFDSHHGVDDEVMAEKFIHTPDQDKSDFHKALDILMDKGVKKVNVYGGSGGEMDHFLGNLSVAYRFINQMEIHFFDEYSTYYFIPKTFSVENIKGKLISFYPFPMAEGITTKGLNWCLTNEKLDMHSRIGTRNFAKEDKVEIQYKKGSLLIFIGNSEYKADF